MDWHIVAFFGFGALSVFVSYLPSPKATDPWYYAPTFHTLQWLTFNVARSLRIPPASVAAGVEQASDNAKAFAKQTDAQAKADAQ